MKIESMIRMFPGNGNLFYRRKSCTMVNWNMVDSFEEVIKVTKKIYSSFYIIGDAKFPPIISKHLARYLLIHNPANFIGEEAMILYGEKDKLFFNIDKTEDYEKAKLIAHKIVYNGSMVQIIFLCSNLSLISLKQIREDSIQDFEIIVDMNGTGFLPYVEQIVYKHDIMDLKKVELERQRNKQKQKEIENERPERN